MRTAAELNYGEIGIISEIDSSHPSSKRIIEHGFTPGQTIELINKSIFNDPIAVSVRGTLIAIRKCEAGCIKLK
ncbi:MAG: ferrous iron transport protein A [Ignavibacteriaceae bacterium]|nr:ferrous iron transport protein A [Ignavibacteriaceae bacterium]MCW8818168.1 ferrous iron transport protein A [Ignavibacteriaceae bacterium]